MESKEKRVARYIRISHIDQNTARQEAKTKKGERVFLDKISGSIAFNQRPAAMKLMEAISANEIDELVITSMDRLGRDAYNCQVVLNYLTGMKINVRVEDLGIESMTKGKPNPMFKLITDVLANVAEIERTHLLERQAEGIAIAKTKGAYRGRPTGTGKTAQQLVDENKDIVKRLKDGTSIRDTGKLTKKSPTTVQRVKKAMIELGIELI